MNRRKPKVVIPTNVDNLVATAERVMLAVDSGDSIAAGSPLVAVPLAALSVSLADARDLLPRINTANEESQMAVSARNEVMGRIRDILIRVRDTSVAISGDRQSPGTCGFEVIQTTSRNGVARVVLPTNPEQFIALANRVYNCVVGNADATMTAVVVGLDGLAAEARARQNEAVSKREAWQLLISQRRVVQSRITDGLRRLRDIGFGIAGPRGYESLSTMGFVVQSAASQGVSMGSSSTSPTDSTGSDVGSDDATVIVADVTFPAGDLVAQLDVIAGFGGASAGDFGFGVDQQVTLQEWIDGLASTSADTPVESVQAAWDAVLTGVDAVAPVTKSANDLFDAIGFGVPESVQGTQLTLDQFRDAVNGLGEEFLVTEGFEYPFPEADLVFTFEGT